MKLTPGKCDYPLPDCGLLDAAGLRIGDIDYAMMQVSHAEWVALRGDPGKPPVCGRPVYFAWFGADAAIRVFPAPDEACEMRVRYFGRLREA